MGISNAAVVVSDSSRKTLPTARRQRRSPEFKRQIVEESFAPGASVARVARAHGVNANQVFSWRQLYRQGRLGTGSSATPKLLAVRVSDPERSRRVAEAPCVPEPASDISVEARSQDAKARRTSSGLATERAGTIQIELPKGRLRVTGAVDRETLRVVLEALEG